MSTVYLPSIRNGYAIDMARQLYSLIRTHRSQRRTRMVWNDTLARVAVAHCRDMAERNYFGHTNPDGVGPNQRVRNAGYRLPGAYASGVAANNIESLAAGDKTAEGTLRAWLNSMGHRPHVFGENEWYAAQTYAAVGYYQGGYYKRYWCFLACHPEE